VHQFDILIPIFNALPELRTCLESVFKATDPKHRIFLLNDASTDPDMKAFLDGVASRHQSVVVIHSSVNRGFLNNVNAGIDATEHDVVLLNSDTLVAAGWLEGLERALNCRPGVGIVSPLFNDASFLSFPKMHEKNILPAESEFEEYANRLLTLSPRQHPEIPAGIGACMLISRKVLDSIGKLDPAFSPGYFEETDFSLRARAAGFKAVCADDIYVFHHSGKSFGEQTRTRLVKKNQVLLDLIWPDCFDELKRFIGSDPFHLHVKALELNSKPN